MSLGDVNAAFERSGNKEAAANPEQGGADETFIDLYAALASVPAIGKKSAGRGRLRRLRSRLKPGQQAILVAAEGRYSFKGSGYVRGGIFDRIEIQQDGSGTRFRDRNHERLGAIEAAGAPALREISLFVVPDDLALDPTWRLGLVQLMVQRPVGPRDKAFLTFRPGPTLPSNLTKAKSPPVATGDGAAGCRQGCPASVSPELAAAERGSTMERDVAAQCRLGRRHSGRHRRTHRHLLFQELAGPPSVTSTPGCGAASSLFTLVWLGWYANAQLSVVNVLTFTNCADRQASAGSISSPAR